MIDIEKVKLDLKMSDSMKVAGCHVLSRETYNDVYNALTELERLQKRDEDVKSKLVKRIELNKQILQDTPDVEIEAENTALEMVMMLMNWSDEK